MSKGDFHCNRLAKHSLERVKIVTPEKMGEHLVKLNKHKLPLTVDSLNEIMSLN